MNFPKISFQNIKFYFDRSNKLILLLIIVLAGVCWYLFFVDMKKVNEKIIEKEKDLGEIKNENTKIQNTINQFDDLTKGSYEIGDILPTEPEIADFLVQIEYLITESGLSPKNISLIPSDGKKTKIQSSQQNTDEFDFVSVNVTVSGEYENMKRFIELCEKNIRILTIDDFTLKKIITPGSENIPDEERMRTLKLLEGSFRISTYFEKKPENPTQ